MTATEAIALLRRIQEGSEGVENRPVALRGFSFVGQDLSQLDLSGMDLSGTDFTKANLSGAQLFHAVLIDAILLEADLTDANLTGADLTKANLSQAKAARAGFGMAKLDHCFCFQGNFSQGTFSKASLAHADFRCAELKGARILESNLSHCDFTSGELRGADISLCDVKGAVFNNADLRDTRMRDIRHFAKAKWIGADIRDINFSGAYLVRRFIMDQNYLWEFRSSGPFADVLYFLWRVSCDCGRSMCRWFLWIVGINLMFAWIYSRVGIDFGLYPTPLSPLYYSVVTFTTLGYGDVMPSTVGGQIAAMSEAVIGYLMLGGLLAILSDKIARRAD